MRDLFNTVLFAVLFMGIVFATGALVLAFWDKLTLRSGMSAAERNSAMAQRSDRLQRGWGLAIFAMALIALPVHAFGLDGDLPLALRVLYFATAAIIVLGFISSRRTIPIKQEPQEGKPQLQSATGKPPNAVASFRNLVNERGKELRMLRFDQLTRLDDESVERLAFDSRQATIGIIVESLPSGGVRVVVQGFMKARFMGSHFALDGFYKYPDETVAEMPDEEFQEFD